VILDGNNKYHQEQFYYTGCLVFYLEVQHKMDGIDITQTHLDRTGEIIHMLGINCEWK
jgi:hypothetical protein